MAITFQKRQKEMKRMEKQRAKAERRAQKKLERQDGTKAPEENLGEPLTGNENTLPPDSEVS